MEVPKSSLSEGPLLEIKGVSKFYAGERGRVAALNNVTFSVAPGEILGIMGKSGAGKSTLLRCLNALETPDEGAVFFKDQNLKSCTSSQLREIREHIGMIFQGFNLLSSRTALDNVALPLEITGLSLEEARPRALECLKLVGLEEKALSYPSQLSGGQKQRVGIARVLASQAEVLLCDEATSALDPETTEEILALLRDLNQRLGLTIILITHEISVIRHLCHRVCVMHEGALVEEGAIERIFLQPQHEVTRRFVKSVFDLKVPDIFKNHLSEECLPTSQEMVMRLIFPGRVAEEPILSQFIRSCPTSVNIMAGHMDHIRGQSFGILLISVPLNLGETWAGFEFLKGKNITVEPIGYLS